MLLAHEQQHNETMLQLIQLTRTTSPVEMEPPPHAAAPMGPEMVMVEGGEVEIGARSGGFASTTSAPATRSNVEPFWIDRTPVTNRAYAEFVADTGAEPPMYWEAGAHGGVVAHGDGPGRAA